MKVLFYGRLADVIGPELDVDAVSGCSVGQLRDRLIARHPDVAPTLANRRARACVGDSMVHDDYVLSDGDAIEFLPPVSGG